jgi:hypothetical protein
MNQIVRGMIVREMELIPLTNIPLTILGRSAGIGSVPHPCLECDPPGRGRRGVHFWWGERPREPSPCGLARSLAPP